MQMISDWGFYAVAIPAVILLGLGKGGFSGVGALSLPLLAMQISPLRGAAIMLPILMVQDVVSVSAYWRQWDWPNLRILLPGAVPVEHFYRIIYVLMALIGLKLCWDGVAGLG